MQQILSYYLPFYLVLYFGIAFIYPSIRTWRHTGHNPLVFSDRDTPHDYIGFVMKFLIALLFVTVGAFSAGEEVYIYLLRAPYLEKEWVMYAGLFLLHVSLIWVIIAQKQMSDAWRIGIDEKNKTELVTHGVFSISRNPVFLGMILTMTGMFLVIPNALSFFLALCTYFTIQVQIRLEEEFLEHQHGEAYRQYRKKTRRLL